MAEIALSFPDGSQRNYPADITGAQLAESISKSLAKKSVAYTLDGTLRDLADPIGRSGKVEIVTRDDPRALELIRHDAAHVLAEAVQELWPGTQVTIGPVIENGFYYDFSRNEPFTPEDFAAIEKKMREIIQRNRPFTKEVWDRDRARQVFRDKGEAYKVELIDAIPEDQDLKIYFQGDWFDLCRGPHMASTGHPDDPEADQRIFALKPMNCPGHVQIFKHGLKSYRDLPIRLAEFGNVHRYEASGALHGLMRVRGFTQDDAHVFCTEEQLEDEILKINDLMMSVYADFGFDEVVVKLATRPE